MPMSFHSSPEHGNPEENAPEGNSPDERDYSTRMDEILGDDGSGSEKEQSDEEMFTYSGLDAPPDDYDTQLQDILGPEDEEAEQREVDVELSRFDDSDEFEGQNISQEDPPLVRESPSRVSSPAPQDQLKRPAFLHPSVSRLRSFVPQERPSPVSHASFATQLSANLLAPSAVPSHFSAISRSSSLSGRAEKPTRDAFRWTVLHTAGSLTHPTSALYGRATVLAANGLLCIGTSSSRALVFDFRQQLKHVIAPPVTTPPAGSVTAIALSTDHTFIAVGHIQGHIYLYDLSRPQTPVRTVEPVALKAVLAGRKEGHLLGTPVTHVGFVGARHTAIVSADTSGLAFYHSLGKVLFVEASDVVRILGKYPGPGETPLGPASEAPLRPDVKGKGKAVERPAIKTAPTSILGIASLPLATTPHPTDTYQIQALITSAKLIVVGLKPNPKTWFRRHNPSSNHDTGTEPLLAWFPAYAPSDDNTKQSGKKATLKEKPASPVLVYTWGHSLHSLRVREERMIQRVRDEKKGKVNSVEIGTLVFEEGKVIELGADVGAVRAVQWLNVQQLLVITRFTILVYDVVTGTKLETFELDPTWLQPVGAAAGIPVGSISHSVKVYKGKTFLLGQDELRVGTLLSWADHILNLVKAGDMIGSIDLAREYYTSTARGNTYGLPPDPRPIVGAKIEELMASSARFAFSEQRMRDGSGAGADPGLYPALVGVCARACAAMGDMTFLYEELWDMYADHGVGAIFLDALAPLVLGGTVSSSVPPVVAQRLVMHCDERGEYALAERLIWHIDPECIDVNHAVGMCKRHGLYDALIYVYTAGLRDYVSPLVELLSLVRTIQQKRKEEAGSEALATYLEEAVPNAYKVFDYLRSVLSGTSYPSKRPIEQGADEAKAAVYAFLCFGRSSTWAGSLVLTAEDEGGTEPTYPYIRQLLKFDAETLLDALDLAFEDSYLNAPHEAVSRQVIVTILLDVLFASSSPSSPGALGIPESAASFIRIFVARNVPKYPQFIHLAPRSQHRVLIELARDSDPDTREDRQLAAEFLLSAYTSSNEDGRELHEEFRRAGFFRILRAAYRGDRRWADLVEAFVQDPGVGPRELFGGLHEALQRAGASGSESEGASRECVQLVEQYLDVLLRLGLIQTAGLLDEFAPRVHARAVALLEQEHLRFKYLRALVQPHLAWEPDDNDNDEAEPVVDRPVPPASTHLEPELRREYLSLMCQTEPEGVLSLLESDVGTAFGAEEIQEVCARHGLLDVVVWAVDREAGALAAIDRLDELEREQSVRLVEGISPDAPYESNLGEVTSRLESLSKMGVRVCEKAGQEEAWFRLLRSQIRTVQNVVMIDPKSERAQPLRAILQRTFSSLTARSSTQQLSFPKLFRRLLDASEDGLVRTKNTYTEFRLILTGMLETYRAEGDVLGITRRLVDQDLFEVMQEHIVARQRGWRSTIPICAGCNIEVRTGPSDNAQEVLAEGEDRKRLMLMASGAVYHQACAPVSVS
ncbi:hypothetical protein BDV93DRAFT_465614 [Ceratobasidium sp. AG-I]|nr:hypothetical protein BDV93DRAFT_465614 [Ceratobasidium sp. AG-I]